jgi:hypothetical protein
MISLHHLSTPSASVTAMALRDRLKTSYSQYFIGMKFFEELPPINPSGMK